MNATPEKAEKEVFNRTEAAEFLGVSIQTFRRYSKNIKPLAFSRNKFHRSELLKMRK